MLKLIKKIPEWVLLVMPLVLLGLALYFATNQQFGACCVMFFLYGVFSTMGFMKDEVDRLP